MFVSFSIGEDVPINEVIRRRENGKAALKKGSSSRNPASGKCKEHKYI